MSDTLNCPYCNWQVSDDWEIDAGEGDINCGKCDRKFFFNKQYFPEYEVQSLPEKIEEAEKTLKTSEKHVVQARGEKDDMLIRVHESAVERNKRNLSELQSELEEERLEGLTYERYQEPKVYHFLF